MKYKLKERKKWKLQKEREEGKEGKEKGEKGNRFPISYRWQTLHAQMLLHLMS